MRRISNNADQIIDLRLIFEGLVVSCIVVSADMHSDS